MQGNKFRFTIKRFLITLFIILIVIVGLLFYFFNFRQSSTTTSNNKNRKKSIQVINSPGNSNYKSIISNGKYKESSARNTVVSTESDLNAKSFEASLNDLSKKYFSPKKYLFQEGQYLSSSLLSNWLGRYSSSNQSGLNPPKSPNNSKNPSPNYIQSIEENDFVKQTSNNKVSLKGLTIGIAMNTEYNYNRTQDGPSYTKKISKQQMVAEGKTAANKVLNRLRQNNRIPKNLPILLVMYSNAPSNNDLTGGYPYAYYLSRSGTKIGQWNNPKIRNIVFPKIESDNSKLGRQDNTAFLNFENQVESYFPNISSATAQAHYVNNNLSGLNINVNTNFYSTSEINAFSSYLSQITSRYFREKIPIKISVNASGNLVAVISKGAKGGFKITYLYNY